MYQYYKNDNSYMSAKKKFLPILVMQMKSMAALQTELNIFSQLIEVLKKQKACRIRNLKTKKRKCFPSPSKKRVKSINLVRNG